jgi:hypothetical protein
MIYLFYFYTYLMNKILFDEYVILYVLHVLYTLLSTCKIILFF